MNQTDASIVSPPPYLPPTLKSAVERSTSWHQTYLESHTFASALLSRDTASVLGLARFGWLLNNCRQELGSIFSMSEFVSLMECFGGAEFAPDDLDDLEGMLTDHCDGEVTPLVTKLAELTSAQRIVLADTLEQVFHYARSTSSSPAKALAFLGVKLS